ncbi:hypothetical protein BDZ97DRAFT_838191 [Flammula alnicola]|nr:hypothetical protein BDZ97DRAFT_838191 [Flammula alnicola]
MTVIENNPFSALSRQIDQFLWASVILVSGVAAIALINMGRLSLFMGPIMFLLTLAHNFTLIGLISRDRKKSADQLAGTLAPTASKANIIICWILAALWAVVVLLIIVVSVLIMGMDEFEGWERLAGYMELPLVVAEICLLVVLATKCAKQRRNTIVQPANVNWQQFGPGAYPQV